MASNDIHEAAHSYASIRYHTFKPPSITPRTPPGYGGLRRSWPTPAPPNTRPTPRPKSMVLNPPHFCRAQSRISRAFRPPREARKSRRPRPSSAVQKHGKSTGTPTICELASELFIFDLCLNFWGLKFGLGAVSKRGLVSWVKKSWGQSRSGGEAAAGLVRDNPRWVIEGKARNSLGYPPRRSRYSGKKWNSLAFLIRQTQNRTRENKWRSLDVILVLP